jgi:(1->4)-alpha-D-glucan 1-alpha-D-glucosylmutase
VDIHPSDNANVTYNAPRAHHELMLYQTMVGSWPYELMPDDSQGLKAFAERLDAWLLKSIREAKRISNWVQANECYEKACSDFLYKILDAGQSPHFLQSLYAFVQEISGTGVINSLAQTLLRNTTPGIPDLYQGAELWDLSMVDPDNRTPVDYEMHRLLLKADTALNDKLLNWKSGALKQHVIQRALRLRKVHGNLFYRGGYVPLEVTGAKAVHILAFMRTEADKIAIVMTPRLTHAFTQTTEGLSFTPDFWQDTTIQLPSQINGEMFDVLTERKSHLYSGRIEVSTILKDFPVALLFMQGVVA